jgi:hypothetical protein
MMKSIEFFELLAAGMQSVHNVLNVGMKVARDRLEISELLHTVKCVDVD